MEYSEQFACIFTPGVVITNNHLINFVKSMQYNIFFDIFRYFSIYCNILTCGSNLLNFPKEKTDSTAKPNPFFYYT